MRYDQLNLNDIMWGLDHVMSDYSTMFYEDEDVKTEVIEKFFDYYENVSLSGMTKAEAHMFVDALGKLYDLIAERRILLEEEMEKEALRNEN